MNHRVTRALAIACFAAATALALAGCFGKKSTTVSTPGGSVTVEQGAAGETTTVKSAEGQVTVGKDAVDPAALGMPMYPGAKPSDNSSMVASYAAKGEGGAMVVLTTDDSFDKVYAYYKAQMPAGSEKMKMSAGGSQIASFQVGGDGAKDTKSVMIQAASGKVTIQLVHSTKK